MGKESDASQGMLKLCEEILKKHAEIKRKLDRQEIRSIRGDHNKEIRPLIERLVRMSYAEQKAHSLVEKIIQDMRADLIQLIRNEAGLKQQEQEALKAIARLKGALDVKPGESMPPQTIFQATSQLRELLQSEVKMEEVNAHLERTMEKLAHDIRKQE
jgi:hypothetical protein